MIRRRVPPKAEQETEERPKGFDDFDLRLGDVLRGERATLGKSLLDVQRELKIKANYIAAIENADPSAFESPGFIPGYVRSYARYLNLDPEWAYQSFCDEADFAVNPKPDSAVGLTGFGAALGGGTVVKKPAKTGISSAGRTDPFAEAQVSFIPKGDGLLANIEPRAIGSTLVLLALIGALGYGGWTVLQQVQRVTVTPVEQAPGVFAEVDPLAAPTLGGEGPEVADVAPSTPDALDRLYRPQPLDAPVMVARDGPIAAIDPAASGTFVRQDPEAARTAELAALQQQRAQAPGSNSVVVMAVRPAWVQVLNADGENIYEETLGASGTYIVPNSEPAPTLRAGAPTGVYFAVDGKVYGPAGQAGTVANVSLDAASIAEAFQVADLSLDPALEEVLERQRAEGVLVAEAREADLPLPRVTAEGPEEVQIVAISEAWMRIRDAEGNYVHETILQPGQSYTVAADVVGPTLWVGNAGAVYFLKGGQAYGPGGANGEVNRALPIGVEDMGAGLPAVDVATLPRLCNVLVADGADFTRDQLTFCQ